MLENIKGSVPVIGVSNEPKSLLAQTADISLSIGSLPDQIVAIQTYTGTLLTLHLLGSHLTNSFDSAVEEVHGLLPTLASLGEANMSSITQWDAFLTPPASLYLLARGASLASAYEGALLFHEVSKSPAVTMPIASFRHGPVEVVDQHFRAVIFAPRGHTREFNLALAHDIVRFGGQVRVIGQPPSSHQLEWTSVPSASPTLAPVFEIVPLQAAAYQLAVLRGIEPGSFRFAPQVAIDEASFGQSPASQAK